MEDDKLVKFNARKDRVLALIVISLEPTIPLLTWRSGGSGSCMEQTIQSVSNWANKLQLRKKLYSLILTQEHIRRLTEIFGELAVVGSPVEEEDQVVHLLASLPESYSMLVTALEANLKVPRMEVITERLVHKERKQKDKEGSAGI